MRGALFPVTIGLAMAATIGLALLAFRPSPPAPPAGIEDPEPAERVPAARPEKRNPGLRPYQTTATLAEDLRDALSGDRDRLGEECWRVSRALAGKARWTLLNLARDEASPKVRAALVLAAGVHAQDEDLLAAYLRDDFAVVRLAAVLAMGYSERGSGRATLLEGLDVPLGRALPPATRKLLDELHARESDATVRRGIEAVRKAVGPKPPR